MKSVIHSETSTRPLGTAMTAFLVTVLLLIENSMKCILLFAACVAWAFAQTGSFVYVNDDGVPNTITGFAVGPNGALAEIKGSPFLAGGAGGAFLGRVASMNRIATTSAATKFLYASNQGSNTIAAFSIDPLSGVLSPVPSSPFPAGVAADGGISVAVSPDDKWLFAGAGQAIAAFGIATDGALAPVRGSPFSAPFPGSSIAGMKVTANGRFLAVAEVASTTTAVVAVFSISEFGALVPVLGSPFVATVGAYGLDCSCSSDRLFTANHNITTEVAGFTMDTNGHLSPVPGSPFSVAGDGSGDVVVAQDDRTLYTSKLEAKIDAFRMALNGALTPLAMSPFPGASAAGLAVDEYSRFLYAADFSRVGAYVIGRGGDLTPVAGQPFSVPHVSYGMSIAAFPPKSCRISTEPSDRNPPTVGLLGVIAGPPKQVQISSRDYQSGLRTIQALACSNCVATTAPFIQGTTDAVITTATKTDATKSSSVQVKATDMAGNSTTFDPVDITIEGDGKPEVHTLSISSLEHVVQITNGDPGIHHLILTVNHAVIPALHLKNGETRTFDIGFALSRGDNNRVTITSFGGHGATASIVFTEP